MRRLICLGSLWLILLGCGETNAPFLYPESSATSAPSSAAPQEAGGGENNLLAMAEEQLDQAVGANDPAAGNAAQNVQRKIIYDATVSLVVEDFSKIEDEIPRLVNRFDGYLGDVSVDRAQGEYRTGRWVVRVPVEKFTLFLEELEKLGVPESRRQTAQDVTEEYVDLEARIANKQRLEERIINLLEDRSGKIKEVIEVERELARIREEIERMQGRLRYLANRTKLTTVTINAREERNYVPPQAPTFGGRIAQAWDASITALRRFGESAVIALVAAAPWIVPLIPVAWYVRRKWKSARRAAGVT